MWVMWCSVFSIFDKCNKYGMLKICTSYFMMMMLWLPYDTYRYHTVWYILYDSTTAWLEALIRIRNKRMIEKSFLAALEYIILTLAEIWNVSTESYYIINMIPLSVVCVCARWCFDCPTNTKGHRPKALCELAVNSECDCARCMMLHVQGTRSSRLTALGEN